MMNIPNKKRKNNPVKVIATLIIILVVAYGISEWLPLKFKRPWLKDILTEQPEKITTVVVNQAGSTGDELFFSRLDSGRWQLNVDNHQQSANATQITTMLSQLKNVVAVEMIPHDAPEFRNTGLMDQQPTAVQIYHDQLMSSHFFVGNAVFDTSAQQIYTYIKKSGDRNAYRVRGNFNELFNQPWKRYLIDPVFDLKFEDLVSVTFRFPCDSTIRFSQTNGKWKNLADGRDINLQALQRLLGNIGSMQPYEPGATDLFWLDQRQKVLFTDQLELKFREMAEPIVLTRILLPDHPEYQHVFRNSLFPYMYYTQVATTSRTLFQWHKMILASNKVSQKAVIGF